MITYYQRTRHIFGPIKLEVLDAAGEVVDTIPASARRGINRVDVVDAGEAAAGAAGGVDRRRGVQRPARAARALHGAADQGRQDVRDEARRSASIAGATFTEADRKAQFDAAMRVHALFGRMSALVEPGERACARRRTARPKALPADGRRPRAPVAALAARADEVRKKIVATTEGGAITGEERLREHADQLYDAILSFEGRPADLPAGSESTCSRRSSPTWKPTFAGVLKTELPAANAALKRKKRPAIAVPPVPASLVSGLSSGDAAALIRQAIERR